MISILKKSSLLVLLVTFISCNKNIQKNRINYFIIETTEEKIVIDNFKVYEDNKGYILLKIKDSVVANKISKSKEVTKFQFKTEDSIYTAKKIKAMFDKSQDLSPFYITIDNIKSGKNILSLDVNGVKMFPIGSVRDNKEFFISQKFDLEKITR